MIALRHILTDFYQLHYDETLPPFDSVRAYSIYTHTLESYTLLVMAKAHRTRALLIFYSEATTSHPIGWYGEQQQNKPSL
jgi:hypothetical protein